mmetsp:Transcript_9841/g.30835  ORF Transcript_9841/g.30835 Transcript_9841/m.30835 type:complete len:339 (-) Transcript_9841:1235-2251(-)
MACLPIAHWYVLRGDWLWCGYGMRPAHTPRMVKGSISRCVVSLQQSRGYIAIRQLFSSFTSRYSTWPYDKKSSKVRSPSFRSSRSSSVTRGTPWSQMIRGRHTRPPSVEMYTARCTVCMCTLTNSPSLPARRSIRMSSKNVSGRWWRPRMDPLRKTSAPVSECSSSPPTRLRSCTPRLRQSAATGLGSSSVVTCVISARFLTRPQLSPSGVSLGHSMPHCEGCSARGPLTFRVFSNWDVMRVIIPSAEMKLSLLSTCVTPLRSMRKRLTVQLPLEMACSRPLVMVSWRMHLSTSKGAARFCLLSVASAWRLRSAFRRLNRSSKSSASSCPASSRRLLP